MKSVNCASSATTLESRNKKKTTTKHYQTVSYDEQNNKNTRQKMKINRRMRVRPTPLPYARKRSQHSKIYFNLIVNYFDLKV